MTQRELIEIQINILKNQIGIIENIVEKDEIDISMLNLQLTNMSRGLKCFIEVNALEL